MPRPPRQPAVTIEDVLVRERPTPLRPGVVDAVAAAAVVLTVLCTGVLALFLAGGGRWFVVETPSMGTAAPVGSIVLTTPVGTADAEPVRVGDVVTFRPEGSPRTWTHRVVRIDADGSLRTRGDVNAADDPWRIPVDALVGRVAAVVPVAGWLVRGLPLLALGALASWALTGPVRDRALRGAVRTLGCTVAVSAVIAVQRPLVDVRLLSSVATDDGVQVAVVSAGLLTTRITTAEGSAVRLTAGEVGRLTVDALRGGQVPLDSAADLGPTGWALLVLVCCVPLVVCTALDRAHPRLP